MTETESAAAIAAFLRARLDEDEHLATDAGSGEWRVGYHLGGDKWDEDDEWTCHVEGRDIRIYDEGGHSREQAQHVARHDPASVLREIAAKRAIVEDAGSVPTISMRRVLRRLAAMYADHPEFRPEWRIDG